MKKVIILYSDDWEGLYVDGELVCQDTRITPETICDRLDIPCENFEINPSFLAREQYLPLELKDVEVFEMDKQRFKSYLNENNNAKNNT